MFLSGKEPKCVSLPAFLRIIFVLTRFTGTFPFHLVKHKLIISNGIFFIFLPILLTSINVAILSKHHVANFSNGEYFSKTVQIITHVNCVVYLFIPFFNRTRIQFAINVCLTRITRESRQRTVFPFSIIITVFTVWAIFNFIKPIIDRDICSFLLFVEKFILGLLELQMCFLLYYLKGAFLDITQNIKIVIEPEPSRFDMGYIIGRKSTELNKGMLESCRKEHLVLYKAMDDLNSAYGLANFMLAIRERFSFAFHLYCWINKGRIFDLILANVNFFQVFLLFYSFQNLKNEEIKLKRFIKELDFDMRKDAIDQLELLKKQVNLLTIKFEACGLFSMDLNMIISIITTTAGYLLLLNQLNI